MKSLSLKILEIHEAKMVNYTKRTIHGVSIVFIMGILSSAVAYVTRIITARNLTPAEYGLFASVLTFLTFFLFFRDLGVGQALAKYIPEFIVHKKFNELKSAITFIVIFQLFGSILFAAVFFALSGYLAKTYFKDQQAAVVLKILLLYLFGSVIFRLFRHISGGFQRMATFSLLEFLRNIAVLGMTVLLFHLGLGVYTPVIAYTLAPYLIAIATFYFIWKIFKFNRYRITSFFPVSKKLFLFSLSVFATEVAGKLITNIDTLILTHFSSLPEVGIYNVVLPSAMIFLEFGTAVSAVFFPLFSELWARNDLNRMTEALRIMHRYLFVIVIPPAVSIIVFSKLLITTFFGAEYASGTLSLQILMIGMFLFVVASVNNNIITAIGRPKTVAKIVVLASIFNVVTNLLLIPKYGINGAAFTTTLSYFLLLILSTNRVIKYVQAKFSLIIWIKLLFAGFVFFAVVTYLNKILSVEPWLKMTISIMAGLMIYVGIAYAYDIVDIKEIMKYWRIVRKKS